MANLAGAPDRWTRSTPDGGPERPRRCRPSSTRPRGRSSRRFRPGAIVRAMQATDPASTSPGAPGAPAAWPVTLAADTGRLPPYDGVAAEALASAGQLLARHPAISLHDHPVRLPDPLTPETWQAWRADGREPVGDTGIGRAGGGAVGGGGGVRAWRVA